MYLDDPKRLLFTSLTVKKNKPDMRIARLFYLEAL